MGPSLGKPRKSCANKTAASVMILLLIASCCVLYTYRSRFFAERRPHVALQLDCAKGYVDTTVDSSAHVDGSTSGMASGFDSGESVPPTSELDMPELRRAVSNMLSAYSNRDVRVVREMSQSAWSIMANQKQHITKEACTRIISPIRQALLDHYSTSHANANDFKTNEHLDGYLDVDMEIMSFFASASREWDVWIASSFFEWYPLRLIDAYRKVYVRDKRTDMMSICDKWTAKWQERIDSGDGYLRNSIRSAYAKALPLIQSGKVPESEPRSSAYQCAMEFSKISGYTPKWISEYAPTTNR